MAALLLIPLIALWLISGAFCGEVAEQKGYSRATWVFAGFLFGFIALIAVAGLPDRKLRKYLRQIGEKQNAIEPEGRGKEWEPTPSDWSDDEK